MLREVLNLASECLHCGILLNFIDDDNKNEDTWENDDEKSLTLEMIFAELKFVLV